jgi:uncharacterized MAPEG superfamily protein
MNIPALSLLFAGLVPFIPKVPMSIAINRAGKGYDNANPRDQQLTLEGMGRRALAAHNNSFEAFPLFAVGVLLALHMQVSSGLFDAYCTVWVLARIAYVWFYVCDQPRWRSAMYGVALICALGNYILALSA